MAKVLKAKSSDLDFLLGACNKIAPSKIKNAGKWSLFRRTIKLAVTPYIEGLEKFVAVYSTDFQELQKQRQDFIIGKKKEDSKEVKDLDKAMKDLNEEFNEKVKAYNEENDKETEVSFDNEAFNEGKIALEESASVIFAITQRDKEGNIKSEQFDNDSCDKLFELLEKAK